MDYHTDLPQESEGLEDFLKYYVSSNAAYHLMSEDGVNVYAMINGSRDDTSIEYGKFSDKELSDFYNKHTKSQDPKTAFRQLKEEKYSLFQDVDDRKKYHLPEINKEKGNILHINNAENEEEFKLTDTLKDYDLKKDDYITMNLVAANEDGFQIDLEIDSEDRASKDYVSLFITTDLENVLASETDTEEFVDNLEEGNFKLYDSLLTSLDDKNRYITAANSSVIADTEEKALSPVDESDYVSRDKRFVYLNGHADPLIEGKQRIQQVDEYFSESDEDVAEFDLNFKQISDELDLKSVNDISLGNVKYANEDFVVLFLNFKGAITGTAGSTDVFVDFQDDPEKPVIYLVDLEI